MRLEEPGLTAERLVDVARLAGDGVEVADRRLQRRHVGGGGIRLDVGAGEGVGVSGAVGGGDVDALGLEGLRHAGGPGEEVERGAGARSPADLGEDGNEAALRAQVLDHGAVGVRRGAITGPGDRTATGTGTWPTLRWAVMAPGDHRETAVAAAGASSAADSHWVRWHQHYDDPSSPALGAVAHRAVDGCGRAERRRGGSHPRS